MLDSHSGAECMHDVRGDMLAKSESAQKYLKAMQKFSNIRWVAAKVAMGERACMTLEWPQAASDSATCVRLATELQTIQTCF